MILEVSWDVGLWTLSFRLSHFHGHGSWLVCEVALVYESCQSMVAHDFAVLTLKGQCKPHGLGIILRGSCLELLLHCTEWDF